MMEMSDDRDKPPLQNKPEEDHINRPPSSSTLLSNWGFPRSNLTTTSLMVDPCNPNLRGQSTNAQNLGIPGINVHNTPLLKEGIFLPGVVPPGLSQFSTDSAFIECAAQFSSFNGGSLCDMMNPLKIPESTNIFCHRVPESNGFRLVSSGQSYRDVSLSVDRGAAHGVSPTNNERRSSEGLESDEAEFSGDCGGAGGEPGWEPSSSTGIINSKKRIRGGKKTELDRAKGAVPENMEIAKEDTVKDQKGNKEISPTTTNKAMMKQGKQGSQALDQVKEEYIHVRARRGQATNSHSLAERVRREKISERMKFLQDLVPGCSKVTGKAVMLDEIINYVQSLQRQVEFLSMKLATVNPWSDLNIETLQAKNIFQSMPGPSSLFGFSPEMPMLYSSPNQSQHGLIIPKGLPPGSSDILKRTIHSQLNQTSSGFKDPSQISSTWEDELLNVVQMRFNGSLPPEIRKLSFE